MKQQKLLIATTNEGKIKEIKHFLQDLPFELVTLDQLDKKIEDPEETQDNLEGNALLKAKYYAEKTGILSLADDTGLFVNSLGGWPGLKSARIAKNDENRRNLLLRKLNNKSDRSAYFMGVLALYDPHTNICFLSYGKLNGEILKTLAPEGPSNYGYNRLFFIQEIAKSYSECTVQEKNSVSHRGKALNKMKYFLQNQYGAKHIVVALPIIIKNGKMLITLRNDPHRPEVHKKWEFPGGIIDFGETGESTAVKEAKEEAGYDVEVIQQLRGIKIKDHRFPTFGYQVYLIPYICKIVGGDGKYSDAEVLDAKWINPEDHRNYDFLEGDNDFLDELMPEIREIIKIYSL